MNLILYFSGVEEFSCVLLVVEDDWLERNEVARIKFQIVSIISREILIVFGCLGIN